MNKFYISTYDHPVGLYCGVDVLQLHVLVAHEYPSAEIVRVEFESALEVQDGLLVLVTQAVVIT